MKQVSTREFFTFFGQRLANLRELDTRNPAVKIHPAASFNPELNILVSAQIDALAKYWALNSGRHFANSESRFGEFLAAHAGEPWAKCSHQNLLARAGAEAAGHKPRRDRPGGPARQLKELHSILHKLLAPVVWVPAGVLPWTQDPSLQVLLDDPDIRAAGIPGSWLQRSRYGEFLYRHYRSGWLHALDPDPELGNGYACSSSPHYVEDIHGSRTLVIPTGFIVESFESAMESFKRELEEKSDSHNPTLRALMILG